MESALFRHPSCSCFLPQGLSSSVWSSIQLILFSSPSRPISNFFLTSLITTVHLSVFCQVLMSSDLLRTTTRRYSSLHVHRPPPILPYTPLLIFSSSRFSFPSSYAPVLRHLIIHVKICQKCDGLRKKCPRSISRQPFLLHT